MIKNQFFGSCLVLSSPWRSTQELRSSLVHTEEMGRDWNNYSGPLISIFSLKFQSQALTKHRTPGESPVSTLPSSPSGLSQQFQETNKLEALTLNAWQLPKEPELFSFTQCVFAKCLMAQHCWSIKQGSTTAFTCKQYFAKFGEIFRYINVKYILRKYV